MNDTLYNKLTLYSSNDILSELSYVSSAISFLERNIDKIDWVILSENPAVIRLLEDNKDKIDWRCLSRNPAAIHLLKANINKINWSSLAMNTEAIELLEANMDKIDLKENYIFANPFIFTYNYDYIKSVRQELNKEIISLAMHPDRIDYLSKIYGFNNIIETFCDN